MSLTLSMALLLGACSGAGPPGGSPDASRPASGDGVATPSDDRPWEQAYGPPDPVDVTVELSPITLTSTVSVEHGGFLSLVGANGTFYQLEIPSEAVLSDVEVTITEVSSVGGSPLGDELVGAVKLEPEGLFLFNPATLTITPATPVAVEEEGPFSAEGDGHDFHLYPLDLDPSVVRMHLMHFSLFGLFKTDAAGRAEMIVRTTADVSNQLQQEMSQRFQDYRERARFGFEDPEYPEDLELSEFLEFALGWYRDQVLRPHLARAERDHTLFIEWTLRWRAWENRLGLFPTLPFRADQLGLDAEMLASWQRALDHYLDKTIERCYEHDLAAIIDLLKIRLAIPQLGLPAPRISLDPVEKCATFTLEMDSQTFNSANTLVICDGEIDQSAWVTASVEIRARFDERLGDTAALGDMQWEDATLDADCDFGPLIGSGTLKYAGFAEAGQLKVLAIGWKLEYRWPSNRARLAYQDTPADLLLRGVVVQPSDPQILIDGEFKEGSFLAGIRAYVSVFGGNIPEGGVTDTSTGSAGWLPVWKALTSETECRSFETSGEDFDRADDTYRLVCWEYVGTGDELARLEIEVAESTSLGKMHEITTFVLRHTPRS